MSHAFAKTLKSFELAEGKKGKFYSLPALAKQFPEIKRLPVSIRIVLESVLRNCDGNKITAEHVEQLARWKPKAERTDEIPFVVSRVVLQDFTGVPLLADLAAMRSTAARLGRKPKAIEPLVPVDLVVDHSIMVDYFGTKKALDLNMKLEFQRNQERYQFMKWGMQAFDSIAVSGYPNLFIINGPNTGLGANSIVYIIEAQVDYILEALDYARQQQVATLEADAALLQCGDHAIEEGLRQAGQRFDRQLFGAEFDQQGFLFAHVVKPCGAFPFSPREKVPEGRMRGERSHDGQTIGTPLPLSPTPLSHRDFLRSPRGEGLYAVSFFNPGKPSFSRCAKYASATACASLRTRRM